MIPFKPAQPTPWLQLKAALMGLEGSASNLREGVAKDPKRTGEQMLELVHYIKNNFEQYFGPIQWPDKPS